MKTKKNEKKSRFNIFDMNRDGKGVGREPQGPPTLKKFFKLLWRKLSKLLSINLIMLPQIPMFVLLILYLSSVFYSTDLGIIYATFASLLGNPLPAASNAAMPAIYGVFVASGSVDAAGSFAAGSSSFAQLMNIYGNVSELPAYSAAFIGVLGGLALFTLITWGWQNIGASYLTRGLVRGDPIFVISDYFYSIKKNLRQGFLFGIIDCLIISLLTVDLVYLFTAGTGFLSDVMLFIIIALIILYLVMRRYVYLMLITFDIKIWKSLKNALIFTILGIKRNLMASAGKLVVVIINYLLLVLLIRINIILPLILPLFYYLSLSSFISSYAAYPVIEKYMIKTSDNGKNADDADGEPEENASGNPITQS